MIMRIPLPPIFPALLFLILVSAPFPETRITVAGIPVYVPEILTLTWLALTLRKPRRPSFGRPEHMMFPLLLLFVGLGLSLVLHFTPHGLGIAKSWFIFPALFAWLLTQTLRSGALSYRQVLIAWFSATTTIALVALAYLISGSLTYDGRLHAFFLSPNALALYAFPAPLIGISLLIDSLSDLRTFPSKKELFLLFALLFGLALSVLTLYHTFSYTVWVSIFFGLAIFVMFRFPDLSRKTLLRVIVGLFSVLLVVLATQSHRAKLSDWFMTPERSSLASRIMIWQSAGKMLIDHPIAGIGPGNFQSVYLDYQRFFPPYLEWAVPEPHNLYLAFWLEAGLPGLAGFLWLITAWARLVLRSMRSDHKTLPVASLSLALLGSVLVQGVFDTPYWKTDLAYIFWLIIALGTAVSMNDAPATENLRT